MTEETLLEVRLNGTGVPSSTDTLVRPLDAGDLRLMAAWAAQELGPELAFVFNGDPETPGGRISIDPDASAPDDVLIRVRTVGRPVTLDHLEVQVEDVPFPGKLAADEYGAAFWSYSAVQKFLFPYLTAIAGDGAVQVLNDLDKIWNGYPDDLPVIALLHRSRRREGRSLEVGELIDVWYVDRTLDGPELRVMAAGDFLQLCSEPAKPQAPPQVSYRSGTLEAADPRLPSEYLLRRIGEWAASVTETPLYFLVDGATGGFGTPAFSLPENLTDVQVIPVFTQPVRERPRVTMTLHPADAEPRELDPGNANAAFWHSGTVTKVLLPYYALAYGASELQQVLALYRVWTGEWVGLPGSEMVVGEETATVFAVVHLPKSDWEEEPLPGTAAAATLGVLQACGPAVPGGVRRTRLSRLREMVLE